MGTNELIRRKFQIGRESSHGTPVAATTIIYADITRNYAKPLQDFPDRSGTFFGRRRAAPTRPETTFSGSDLLTYEDIVLWGQMGIAELETGDGDEGTPEAFTLCLARLIRCAMVASGTRNARAISAVVSPPTARSVSAIADPGVRAG